MMVLLPKNGTRGSRTRHASAQFAISQPMPSPASLAISRNSRAPATGTSDLPRRVAVGHRSGFELDFAVHCHAKDHAAPFAALPLDAHQGAKAAVLAAEIDHDLAVGVMAQAFGERLVADLQRSAGIAHGSGRRYRNRSRPTAWECCRQIPASRSLAKSASCAGTYTVDARATTRTPTANGRIRFCGCLQCTRITMIDRSVLGMRRFILSEKLYRLCFHSHEETSARKASFPENASGGCSSGESLGTRRAQTYRI